MQPVGMHDTHFLTATQKFCKDDLCPSLHKPARYNAKTKEGALHESDNITIQP